MSEDQKGDPTPVPDPEPDRAEAVVEDPATEPEDDWQRRDSHSSVRAAWWGVRVRAVVVFFTAAGFVALLYQIHMARQSAAESEKAAEAALEKVERMAAAGEDTARAAVESARAAEETAAASAEAARTAAEMLLTVRDGQRLDQRAWVGSFAAVPRVKEGETVRIDVRIQNTGRTPALGVTARMGNFFGVGTFTEVLMLFRDPWVVGALHPGVKHNLINYSSEPLKPDVIEKLRAGDLSFWSYGAIEYQDVFGASHKSTYCFVLRTNLTEMGSCGCCTSAH